MGFSGSAGWTVGLNDIFPSLMVLWFLPPLIPCTATTLLLLLLPQLGLALTLQCHRGTAKGLCSSAAAGAVLICGSSVGCRAREAPAQDCLESHTAHKDIGVTEKDRKSRSFSSVFWGQLRLVVSTVVLPGDFTDWHDVRQPFSLLPASPSSEGAEEFPHCLPQLPPLSTAQV